MRQVRLIFLCLPFLLSGCVITTTPKGAYLLDAKAPAPDEGIVAVCRTAHLGAAGGRTATAAINGELAANLIGGAGLEVIVPKGRHRIQITISGLLVDIGQLAVTVDVQEGKKSYLLLRGDQDFTYLGKKAGSIEHISWRITRSNEEEFNRHCFQPVVRINRSITPR